MDGGDNVECCFCVLALRVVVADRERMLLGQRAAVAG